MLYKSYYSYKCITLRQRRLRWLGQVHRMDADRIPREAIEWRPNGKRGKGRLRMTWTSRATPWRKDLSPIGLSWDLEAELTKEQQ